MASGTRHASQSEDDEMEIETIESNNDNVSSAEDNHAIKMAWQEEEENSIEQEE
jgi:hypothetical protein